jgi:hypothetical protein
MRQKTVFTAIAVSIGLTVSGSAVATGTHPLGLFAHARAGADVAAPNIYVVPAAIDATGRTDVSSGLNAFIAAVPDGGTIVFPANGQYRIEGTLHVENKTNIRVDGNGSLFFARTDGSNVRLPSCNQHPGWASCREPNRLRPQWSFLGDHNILVRDVNVRGSNPDAGPKGEYNPLLEAQHGFQIVGTDGIVLDHVSARAVWGDFVNVGVGLVGRRYTMSTNVLVENSTFRGSSRQGWSVTDAQHVTFVHNSIDQVRRSLIDLEANTATDVIAYVTIEGNTLGRSRLCTVANGGAGAIEHDFVISGNHMLSGVMLQACLRGTAHARRRNLTVSGNVGSRTPNSPMLSVAYFDNITVRNNVQQFSMNWPWRGAPQAPVTLRCSGVVAVTGNNFSPRPAGMPAYVRPPC